MKSDVSAREKWQLLLQGKDTGPMVSPLCDDWSLDSPYHWPYEDPDPFPPGHRWHALSQQMAMAKVCGWDPTFLSGVDMPQKNQKIMPESRTTTIDGGSRTESRVWTPYGELSCITEQKATAHTVKQWLETEGDFRRATWLAREQIDYDEDVAIEQGQQMRRAVGAKGILGTWFGPPTVNYLNRDMMFYHMADWPHAFMELHQATRDIVFRQVETFRKAGFDYLFYCVDGTEWISPDFFREWVLENTREIFKRWRAMGGFILWHSCGRLAKFVELGFYNDLKPEIMETFSEPPVGNLPSLRWARERMDRSIATKGNIPLNILLNGTEDDVRQEVRRVRDETSGYRHIVGLSDDMLHHTPLANARAFVDEARRA